MTAPDGSHTAVLVVGGPTAALELGGLRLVTDPTLSPAGVQETTPSTLTTPAAAGRLGGTAHGLQLWAETTLPLPAGGSLTVTAVPARHGPPGCEPITGEVTGCVLTGDGRPAIYVSGDNASLDAVREIAARFGPIDIALLFAGAARTSLFDGAPLTLTGADAAVAVKILGARCVVPLHVRGWAHFSECPVDILAAFEAAGLADRLRGTKLGQRVDLSA